MANLVTYQQDGSASVWTGISQPLADALNTATKVTDQTGKVLQVQNFQGGYLVNGCPLNVWFGQGWQAGQQDALVAAGITQCLPATPTTPVTTRCYYQDGTITEDTTCPLTSDTGSPLLQSEGAILNDTADTIPSVVMLGLVAIGIYILTKK